MPRPRRVHVPGGLYHAVLRGNHRRAIFDCAADHLRFEDILADALERYDGRLLAYCWMTNHVHLAVRVADAPLGAMMGVIASRYARARQRALATTGHCFERRYRSRLVDSERYLLALVRYLHLNPVRAGIVADPGDYPWSSHRAYLGATCPRWLHVEPVLARLGSTVDDARAAYARYMCEAPDARERDVLSAVLRRGRKAGCRESVGRDGASALAGKESTPRPDTDLPSIAARVATAKGCSLEDLRSPKRRADLALVRAEIALEALAAGAANLTEVAKYLNRSVSTLSERLRSRGRR